MDLVEKVARTMCVDDGVSPELPDFHGNEMWKLYIGYAKSAIATIEADVREESEPLRKALIDAQTLLRFSFNRIHVLPRSRDTELADDIQRCLARIADVLKAAAIRKGGKDE